MRDAYIRAERDLRRHFGHPGFREHQRPVVEAMLAGRDVLAVLPTGAGKSACFQVPSLQAPGLTLVVSPLISLMEDQVAGLRRRGMAAVALTSAIPGRERRRLEAAAAAGEVRLLYVSPERLGAPGFRAVVAGARVARVVVDEAHCISEWGHDFRPVYRRIADFVRQAGRPPVAAFTATATALTRADIEASLELRAPIRHVAPVDRPNLRWEVRRAASLGDGARLALGRLRCVPGAAIAYLPTRDRALRLAEALRRLGVVAAPYHAGLPSAVRSGVQEDFLAGRLRVVCATNAFGMGIDHPSVRLVCHLGLPASLEGYVQEAGRAGRDGDTSSCFLIACPNDLATQRRLAAASWPSPRVLSAVWEAAPPGVPVTAAMLERPRRRFGQERVVAALRLFVQFGCARLARGGPYGADVHGSDGVVAAAGAPGGAGTSADDPVVRGPDALRRRIDFSAPARARGRARHRLAAMRRYARTRRCRRAAIARYFGDRPPACAGCDRCRSLS